MFKSAYETLDGIVYFPRMLEKIRMEARGEIPEEYKPYLGTGFDGRCVQFLGVDYAKLKERVLAGKSDDEVMEWCKENGTPRTDDEKLVWNEFMKKRGWRDSSPHGDSFQQYKARYGYGDRDDIETYFDFFEVDEGRAK
jgi:hypothetical protein